ncbi:hypothetical protein BDAP_000870 [Binucleata daphniae]
MSILSADKGPKVLLFDPDTTSYFSNIIPHSTFLEYDFFVFENTTNKTRQKLSQMTCYFLIRPTNVHLVFAELKDPYYDNYVLMFTNTLDDNILIKIAQADLLGLVSEVYEVYIDCSFEDENLYIIDQNIDLELGNLDRITEGLSSVFKTLNIQPMLHVQKNCELLTMISKATIKLTENLNNEGQAIMLHRSIDMYTPLIYSWTFQALAYDFLPYQDGIVNLNNKTYGLNDNKMFQKVKFLDINTAANELKNYYKSINETKVSNNVVQMIEEKIKKSEIAESLLNVQNYIADECIKNKDLSDLEHQIIKNNKLKIEDIQNVVKNKCIPIDKRLKLLLIFCLRNKIDMFKTEHNGKGNTNVLQTYFPEYLTAINNFCRVYKPFTPDIPSYVKDIDYKLGYTPIISKITNKFFQNMLNKKKYDCYKKTNKNHNLYIVCFVGGLTYIEYKAIKTNFSNVTKESNDYKLIIIADRILGWNDIYKKIKN